MCRGFQAKMIKYCKCLGKCGIITLFILYLFVICIHYITCYLHVGFCTPLHKFRNNLINPYDLMDENQYKASIQEVWNDNYQTAIIACNTSFKNPFPKLLKLGILLTDTNKEANYISKQLNTSENIMIVNTMNELKEESLINSLDQTFDKCTKFMHIKPNNELNANIMHCFIEIYVNKIDQEWFKFLVDYIYCHDIMVLQIYRQALIASIVDEGDNFEEIDSKRERLEKMIKLHVKYIKHQKFDYEDLIGKYSHSFWDAMLAWIGDGLSSNDIVFDIELNQNNGDSCLLDDGDWDLMQDNWKDTEPYYLCRKYCH